MNEQQLISEILEREGSTYTDRASDRGGPTKYGIKLAAWRMFIRNPAAGAADVAAITEEQARAFYVEEHILGPGFDQIRDENLRAAAVDAGVNHGVKTAVLWLQSLVGLSLVDGHLGPQSLAAINGCAPIPLALRLVAKRLRLFGRLVSADPVALKAKAAGFRMQAENAAGWNNRGAQFIEDLAGKL